MKKMIITGNVGRDPEVRVDPTGNNFTTFSVGVSVGTKDNPKTDWVDISCNGKLAEIAQAYVKKGAKVLIEGFPSVNAYVNKDNKPIGTIRIFANTLELLSKREDESSSQHMGNDTDTYQLPEINKQASYGSSSSLGEVPF